MIINKNRAGFTLIELLVVISIIGLLSTVVLASLSDARENTKIRKAQVELHEIWTAAQMYYNDHGGYPREGLDGYGDSTQWNTPDCSDTPSVTVDRPNGVYINASWIDFSDYIDMPTDPWGHQYWVDSVYWCAQGVDGVEVGCENQVGAKYAWAIGSGGPNGSGPNGYDSDNVILMVCDYPG